MHSRDFLLRLYRQALLIRMAEDRICAEYSHDEMKTPAHLCVGAEGIHAGVLEALPKGTRVFGTYRSHGLYLGLTGDTDGFFAELYGKESGVSGGKAGSMHLCFPEKGLILTSAVVATTLPVACGAAFANAYRGKNDWIAVFFGDGALEEGAFWETLNFACLHKLKLFFVCEDNGLAIHTPAQDRRGFRSILEVLKGFKCHGASADGYYPETVYEAARGLLENAEKEPAPVFLYAPYYRYSEHVGVLENYKAGYRPKPTEEELQAMDPVKNLRKLAQSAGAVAQDFKAAENEIREKIDRSVEKAKAAAFPGPEALLEDVTHE